MNKTSEDVSKIPLKNIENPHVYSSISNVIMKKQIAWSMEDAMKNATGVSKLWDATGRPDGGSIFSSRGFPTTTRSRNGLISIMSDNVDMVNTERLEVIKGPSATLFGSIISSYGGLVNRVTKKPFFTTRGEAELSGGAFNFYRAAADVNVPLNKVNTLAGRINFAYRNQDSWQDSGFNKNFSVAPSLLYKPNENLEISLDAEIIHNKGNSNGGNFVFFLNPSFANANFRAVLSQQGLPDAVVDQIMSKAPQTFEQAYRTNRINELKLDYNKSFNSDDIYLTNQTNSIFGKVDYKINSHWKSLTAVSYSHVRTEGHQSYQYLVPDYIPTFISSIKTGNPTFGTPGHNSIARMVWSPNGSGNTFNIQQNFQSEYDFGKINNRIVVGIDYTRVDNRFNYDRFTGSLFGLPFPDVYDITKTDGTGSNYNDFTLAGVKERYQQQANLPGTNVNNPSLPYFYNNSITGVFINNVTKFSEHIIASLGLRYDNFKSKGTYDKATDSFKNSYTQDEFSPKVGLVYMPIPDKLSFFTNYQNGFTNKNGVDSKGKTFVPERANQYEVGMKADFFNNKLTGTLSYYDITVKNVVRSDANNPIYNVHDGQQRSKGMELEIFANPLQGWLLMAGYGYNHSIMEKADQDVQGLRPAASGPEHTLNFWTNYTFSHGHLKGFGMGFSTNYASEALS
ncbi:iron complex outermembrane recepter protein [Cruoricaptor ignavus]|uniref:Iron complex outermembrane recepter protein n=1 Tax=Cruoricaptor ignavus TaxID=1118202 RepID=A0A1M6HKQ6_9FLAO|nr:TonB-dependent receptor [Cruoricaptor ignavus]SHJ22771.1 iron complex outermembrane recepter protein [Cruoricaptor ignavus]